MKEISRRDFLTWTTMAGGGALLAACSLLPEPTPTALPRPTARPTSESTPALTPTRVPTPTPEPTRTRTPEPTKTATRTPKPTKTSTPEPTKTLTPEPPKLLEKIETGIPGLSVERYEAKFQDITSEVPESDRRDIEEWVAQPEFHLADNNSRDQSPKENLERVWNRLWPVSGQCGLSFVSTDKIRPNHDEETFYYDGNAKRFFTNILGPYSKILAADGQILNQKDIESWFTDWRNKSSFDMGVQMSGQGQILYNILSKDKPTSTMMAILADIPHGTKTVIKDMQRRSFESRLASDGNKLLLALPADPEAEKGIGGTQKIYLLDLNSGQVRFKTDEQYSYLEKYLNEDGSRLYLNKPGCMYNTTTGEKKLIPWPTFLSSFWASASPNLNYIVRELGMFSAWQWVEGQWGIMAYTPDGFFMISSPDWSWPPYKVDNDGTIYTNRSDIFKFEGGTYKLVKTGLEAQFKTKDSGKPIEVMVSKFVGVGK